MSQCKKFTPNIFNKTKCSNCFRQKEEHSAEALECNRASRSVARSGYLFVAPDWDFSVPLNRTKRWQRRWFVLYDDGELNYSVDEHPDTIPQGSVDMSKVLEVTAAEQITGHPHSVALTSPDRVTFIKAASREDARWWVELLAMFPRRHKRNATFPGGRASPSLPQLGRSASPQPPRPRFLSCTTSGPSPRTNFETPPLKEERESPPKDEQSRPKWLPEPTKIIEVIPPPIRNEYVVSSGSPPTRDKLRCDDKARARRDWRNERLRDIATALTDRSPESSLALPAEGLLHLKKGWLWLKNVEGEWIRRWIVLCVPTLTIYQDQDEQANPEQTIELSSVSSYNEVLTESKYGFEIHWTGQTITLSAVTAGIRGNWLEALKKTCPPITPTSSSEVSTSPTTARSVFLSSDDEYKTASENDRRLSISDWSNELPPSPPLNKYSTRLKEKGARIRSRFSRCQSRQNTVDSTSTDELDAVKETEHYDLSNTLNKQNLEIHDLQSQLSKALKDKNELEEEIARLKKIQSDAMTYEKKIKDLITNFEKTEKELNQRNTQTEIKFIKEQKGLHRQLLDVKDTSKVYEDKVDILTKELQSKKNVILVLQEDLTQANDNLTKTLIENEKLLKLLKDFNQNHHSVDNPKRVDTLTNLIDINLDIDIEDLGTNELKEYALDLKSRFERSIIEIRTIKKHLKESTDNIDRLELNNFNLEENIKLIKDNKDNEINLLINRLEYLTTKLNCVEKQLRSKTKTEQREKRRSLSLKGKESFSLNKEVEDKVTELEGKIDLLEKNGKVVTTSTSRRKFKRDRSGDRSSPIDDKSLRRLRRKSLDSVTASEPLKILMRLSTLESKVTNINLSNESLNMISNNSNNSSSEYNKLDKLEDKLKKYENIINEAKIKLNECLIKLNKNKYTTDKLNIIDELLNELSDILNRSNVITNDELEVIQTTTDNVVKQFEQILVDKLQELYQKKRILIDNNNYDYKEKLKYLSEKIAFEQVIIEKLQEAYQSQASCDRLINKEIKETAYLINSLKLKFKGKTSPQPIESKTSVDYLSKVLSNALISLTNNKNTTKRQFIDNRNHPSLQILIEEQEKLNEDLKLYKLKKLPQLAEVLANETMHLIQDKGCILTSIKNETKNKFIELTKEKVNVELMQAEINHVLLKAAQIYQNNLNSDNKYFFTFYASERAALELWSDSIEDYLYDEITKNITELIELYQTNLNKLQKTNWRRKLENERINLTSNVLLNEFADIVSHKLLIDARINVLTGKFDADKLIFNNDNETILNNLLINDDCWNYLDKHLCLNRSLESEFLFMIDSYNKNFKESIDNDEFYKILNCLNDISDEIIQIQKEIHVDDVNCENVIENWNDVCSKCLELKEKLIEVKLTLKDTTTTNSYDIDIQRPIYLGAEYLTQVESLRSAYRCVLASCKDTNQENDIEKLKLLCEKVLVSMEQWHHKTIKEMREKHSIEMDMLKDEKEQALKEETQATLAALDAMRKAHEAEVQREVAKFKQEFARQQRNEVVELSEKLSVKRLEAAALSEQLGSASRQLAHAQQHILALERQPPHIAKI